mgnify:CR=1 FL=1
MNELTKELAEQAGGHYPNGIYPKAVMFYPHELEMFVELIVQECVNVGSLSWLSDNSKVPTFPAKQIKEHFGVK